MSAVQRQPFALSVASLYLQYQAASARKLNMPSPISPAHSPFSIPSPISTASSTSFPNENSPISESHFDRFPSPIDAVNGDVAVYSQPGPSFQMFTSAGGMTSPPECDYDMMALVSEPKKQEVPSLPQLQLYNHLHRDHQQAFMHPHSGSFLKSTTTNPMYIPSPLSPQQHGPPPTSPTVVRSPESTPFRSPFHHHQQWQPHLVQQPHHSSQPSLPSSPPTTNMVNGVVFGADLDDWHTSPTQMTSRHPNSSYPLAPMESQQMSQVKRNELMFSMSGFPVSAAATGHHPHSRNNQYFDLSAASITSSQNAGPTATAHPQQPHHQSDPAAYYSPHQIHHAQFQHHDPQQQPYTTVHPAEVSPLDACTTHSPLPSYHNMAVGDVGIMGVNNHSPDHHACAADMGSKDLKSGLDMDLCLRMNINSVASHDDWSNQRKNAEGPSNSGFGGTDAETGQINTSEPEEYSEGRNSFTSLAGVSSAAQSLSPDEGGDEGLTEITDDSKFSEESSTDSDDSEFVPASRQGQPRRTQTSVFPSSYHPYEHSEDHSLRTRSGTKYNPGYSVEPDADAVVGQPYDDEAPRYSGRSRRHADPPSSLITPGGDSSSAASTGYLNFTTLSAANGTTVTRRRLRPSSNSQPIPVPIPHLTKKSRGRRVPTVSSLEDMRSVSSGAGRKRQVVGKGARMYLCEVEGCGKCFARGEHLKRHVRSIHTYEKPHRCPYPGCGKDFSRHDNLGQHMRVHKGYVPPSKA